MSATSPAIATPVRLAGRTRALLVVVIAALAVVIWLSVAASDSQQAGGPAISASGEVAAGSGVTLGRHMPPAGSRGASTGFFPHGD